MNLTMYLMLTNYYLDLSVDCNTYTNTMCWGILEQRYGSIEMVYL